MAIDTRAGNLCKCVAALICTAAATVGSPGLAATTNILFEQPSESGIANNIYVAYVDKGGLPKGSWDLVALQPDPFSATGHLVTTAWDAGSQTGFTPTSPAIAQLGYRNLAGTSTAQMEGDTVGAYIDSRDLPTTLSDQLMMLSPQYKWPVGSEPVVFASSTAVLHVELDVQVPTAEGKETYVTLDLLFLDPNGTRLSLGAKIFDNGAKGAVVGSKYDPNGNVTILNSPLATGQEFLSLAKGSMVFTGAPWGGYRHVQFSISQSQMTAALKSLMVKFPGTIKSSDTTQYVLGEVHLNAEFHYSPAPAYLGWSMKNLKVWSTG